MKREQLIPRPDWPQKMEAVGFGFHSIDGIYWDERACYAFTADEIDQLEAATAELHEMCITAAQHVISNKLYDRFAIPPEFVPLIEKSWHNDEPSLFGRFDFSWDGHGAPKLLEYNADTPTSLIEASVAQWHWLQEVRPDADQFNSLHEQLISRFAELAAQCGEVMYFACIADSEEDVGNLDYLRDVAMQAGIDARAIDMGAIGWDAIERHFVDESNREIETLFKLYPWEWMVREAFGHNMLDCTTRVIEPAWKMLLANKAILPVLWSLYPDHPNLLRAFFEAQRFPSDYVKKPLLSREGANVTIHRQTGGDIEVPGEYGAEGFIYQGYHPLPTFGDGYMVIGSWTINGNPAGIGIREDESLVTKNTSRFVPHYFT